MGTLRIVAFLIRKGGSLINPLETLREGKSMVSKYLKMLVFIMMGGLLACAAPQVQKPETDFQPYDLGSELKDGFVVSAELF